MSKTSTSPVFAGWMRHTLILAAAYNVLWGASVIFFPNLAFDLSGLPRPVYPQIWQCVGMVVGVYGVAYGIASTNPIRHWPIVFAGFLGKLLGSAGFVVASYQGVLPLTWSWMILANDLVWWIPFALILHNAYRDHIAEPDVAAQSLRQALQSTLTHRGTSVAELSEQSPVLLVFLRHFGCTFCRETLSDVAARRHTFDANRTQLVLVHMSEDGEADRALTKYGLENVDRVSDPDRHLYRAIGLRRGTLRQLLGFRVFARGIKSGIIDGHRIGWPTADPFQMPGAFLIKDSEIVQAFQHEDASQRPDYGALSVCEASNARMRKELEQAAKVQKALLPKALPKVEGGSFAWSVVPMEELAGDTLNVVRLDEDHVALYVLDVSGHGVSSALLSVTLNHWLSPERDQSGLFTKGSGDTYRIVSPVEVAEQLNGQFPMDADTGQYFTMIYGILDTRTFEFRYVTAGHPAPVRLPAGRDPEQLPGTGLPIGLIPGAEYQEHYVRLRPNDRLYLFSDGVFEASDQSGDEFGIDAMMSELSALRNHDLDESVDGLLYRVKQWREGAPYSDDLSVLSFQVASQEDEKVVPLPEIVAA